jgi:F-type H+-transporting ATPase subunit b
MLRRSWMKKGMVLALAHLMVLGLSTTLWAAGDYEMNYLKDFIYRVINFAVAFGLIAYFVTKPIRKAMAGRSEGVAQQLDQSRSAREAAEAKFAEYDAKLNRATAEIEEIYASIRREGEMEREKIIANAMEMAEKIKADAQKAAANEVSTARAALRKEAAALAVALAEDLLRKNVTEQDQARLIDEYMQKVGELH